MGGFLWVVELFCTLTVLMVTQMYAYGFIYIYIYKITHTQSIEVIQGYDESA